MDSCNPTILKKAASRISNGSAADVYGWTGDLIQHLLYNKECERLLNKLITAILNGGINDEARDWLLASWLIALDKGEGRVRPIAGGSILIKLASTYLLLTATNQAKALFSTSGLQCGVFTRDGTTTAAKITQLALELDPNNIALKVDFQNAFNSLRREALFEALFNTDELASFWRMAHWAYKGVSHLWVKGKDGTIVDVVESKEGVRQGCTLGSLLFAAASLGFLSKVKQSSKDIEVAAFLDDVCIVGAQQPVIEAFRTLSQEAKVCGLEVQRDKCVVLLPTEESVDWHLQRGDASAWHGRWARPEPDGELGETRDRAVVE